MPDQPLITRFVRPRLVEGFQGYLSVDGYEAYNAIGKQPGIIVQGCSAHARRMFDEALNAQSPTRPEETPSHANQAMKTIQALYRIERKAKSFCPEQRYELRQAKAKPRIEEFRGWLDEVLPTVPPRSLTRKALRYLDNQWTKLIRYLDDGRLAIDNNLTENAIRPFVIGRKAR